MAQGTELRAQGTGQEEGGGERESGKVTSRKLIEKSEEGNKTGCCPLKNRLKT